MMVKLVINNSILELFNSIENSDAYKEYKKMADILNKDENIKSLESTTNIDVTGGMVGKVKELLELAELGVESEIINANEPGVISKVLQGIDVPGTKISKN